MPQGIILAAGYSSRANANKMLFPYEGVSLLIHSIEGMKPFVDDIFVVVGCHREEISEALQNCENVHIVFNEHFDLGMFSSIRAGAKCVSEDFFILPGDCPLVNAKVYQSLLLGKKAIRVPSNAGRIGHPIFISISLKDELLNFPSDSNLKVFRDAHDYEIIETSDENILLDIDTPEDYQELLKTHRKG